jgi:protein arginine N-methyltransferase 1
VIGYDATTVDAFDFHHSMLVDEIRTSSFLRAIAASVEPGDVVVDIGSGTGVLSLFAVRAGAARVYAIECGPIIGVAREIAARNGMTDSITFIEGSSSDVEIPERADVLITETIGNIGFDEGIVAWVTDAKERFLKPDATILPQRVDAVACLVSVPREYRSVERWSQPLLALDFTPLSRIVRNNVRWTDLSPAAITTRPAVVFGTDFSSEPNTLRGSVRTRALNDAVVHGIGLWFESCLTGDVSITNAPPNVVPSWEQGFLPLSEPVNVAADEPMGFEVSTTASGNEWAWSVGSGSVHTTADGGFGVHQITEKLD